MAMAPKNTTSSSTGAMSSSPMTIVRWVSLTGSRLCPTTK
jgi:hypothetical protein